MQDFDNWKSYGSVSRYDGWSDTARLEDRVHASTFSGTVTWDAYNECACSYTNSYTYTAGSAWNTWQSEFNYALPMLLGNHTTLDGCCDSATAGATDTQITVGTVTSAADAVTSVAQGFMNSFVAAANTGGVCTTVSFSNDTATDPAMTESQAVADAKILVARIKIINSTLKRIDQSTEDAGFFLGGIVGMMQWNQGAALYMELGMRTQTLKDLKARFPNAIK